MRRVGGLYERIAEPDTLRLAFWRASRGHAHKSEVVAYRERLYPNLAGLRQEILDRDVRVGDYRFFTIRDPKERTICAASFRERVLHHAVMAVCETVLERCACFDSYACRPGKGLHRAVARAQSFARGHAWHLKLDIRKYFDSVDHSVLLALLERQFKERDLLDLFRRILDSYHTEKGRGLPIGNLVSQHLANFYLGGLDHWIKESRRVPAYVRYMDDFVLWRAGKDALDEDLKAIAEWLAAERRLCLKDNVQLNRSVQGLPFLGFRVYPGVLRLAPRSKRRFVVRLRQYERKYIEGVWDEAELARHMGPVTDFVKVADSAGFRADALKRFGQVE